MGQERVLTEIARAVVVSHLRSIPSGGLHSQRARLYIALPNTRQPAREEVMPHTEQDSITVIREEERPVVDFIGGATYRTILADDTAAGIPIRTGIQTSPP